MGTGLAFKHLFAYGLTGELAEGGEEYLASPDIEELPHVLTLADTRWDGAPLELNEDGAAVLTLGPAAAKEPRLLTEGDVITTIWQISSLSGDDDFEMFAADELTVTADTSFGETPLYNGRYAMVFELWDAMGNYALSDAVTFDCLQGEITTTVYE